MSIVKSTNIEKKFCESETTDPIFSNIIRTPETNFLTIFQYQPSHVLMDDQDVGIYDISGQFKMDKFIADDDIEMTDLSDEYYAHYVNVIDDNLLTDIVVEDIVLSRNKIKILL